MTGLPNTDRYVQVDEALFVGRPASFAADTLEKAGLVPTVTNQFGAPPEDLGGCTVTEVAPEGRIPVAADVVVRCDEEEGPPR